MNSDVFKQKLAEYKTLVDADIQDYSATLIAQTEKTYGESSALIARTFTDILSRGGKRVRGTLTMVGFSMVGGTDSKVAITGARVVEMMHAYMLLIDDIQDRSDTRRGGPSGHKLLEAQHTEHNWSGDAAHTGVSLAINAALLGSHSAQTTLGTMPIASDRRIEALNILNHTIATTVHGQTHDIINEVSSVVTEQDINNTMQWKTAHYTFLNPLQMGMVLAGAAKDDTEAIVAYAMNAGKTFQISDDLLIMSTESGKDAIDDIREGKQTLLTFYALEHASNEDKVFLRGCLGNRSVDEAQFKRCQQIFIDSGAVTYAQGRAQAYVEAAKNGLTQNGRQWRVQDVAFLEKLVDYLLSRTV